jgi:hypothetical protein
VITISDAHADEQLSYGANTPLSGTCQYEFDRPYSQAMRRCALRAEYFGPNLPRQHTAMSYIDEPIPRPRGTFRFRFAPPLIWDGPKDLAGTLLIFLQMFDAEDWAKNVGTRRISNVTFMVATLRPSA